VLTGSLGAVLIGLALRSGLIPALSGGRLSAMLAVCMVAGTSERLVPSFIEQIETQTKKTA
jgi:hypothetical protein